MPSVNPGPASTSNANSVAALSEAAGGGQAWPQEQNQIRLLAAAKSVDCSGSGDRVSTKIINSQRWVPTAVAMVATQGATQTPTAAFVGAFTNPGAAAYTILAVTVLTNLTSTQMVYTAAANTTSVTTDQTIYINVGTTTAAGLVDVLIYGYDLTT
jgi:hypothetical protein